MGLISQLPKSSEVGRIVPKNAFDSYANTKQRKLFSEKIERIRWTHKLALDTINLQGREVGEIQIFEIELRDREEIEEILTIIDRAVPYPILFVLKHKNMENWRISKKHLHPTNENNAVIDWTFSSSWFDSSDVRFELNLKGSLDEVFRNLCLQITGKTSISREKDISSIVEEEKKAKELLVKIEKLKFRIANEKQFNRRVELNLELQKIQLDYDEIFPQ